MKYILAALIMVALILATLIPGILISLWDFKFKGNFERVANYYKSLKWIQKIIDFAENTFSKGHF